MERGGGVEAGRGLPGSRVNPLSLPSFCSPAVPVADIEAFAKADPYVIAGLVPSWSVRGWLVVAE